LESAGPPACAVTETAAGRGGDGAAAADGRVVGDGAASADGRVAGDGAAAAAGRTAGDGTVSGDGRGAGGAAAAWRLGARSSTAHASRWRIVDRCESQHATEQNTRRVRSRLQVDTLQTQCVAPNRMGFRHALQIIQTSSATSTMAPILRTI